MDRRDRFDLFLQCRDPIQRARVTIAHSIQRNTTEPIPQEIDHWPRKIRVVKGAVYEEKWWSGPLFEIVNGPSIGKVGV